MSWAEKNSLDKKRGKVERENYDPANRQTNESHNCCAGR